MLGWIWINLNHTDEIHTEIQKADCIDEWYGDFTTCYGEIFPKTFYICTLFLFIEINLYEAGNDIAKKRFNEMSTVMWRQLNQKNNEICPIRWFTLWTWSEISLKCHNLLTKIIFFLQICEWNSPKYKGRQNSTIGQSVERC